MNKKVIFEGTQEEIDNLIMVTNNEAVRRLLPTLRPNYHLGNMWCLDDVQSRYECTDEEARYILERALTNEATMNQIWFSIDWEIGEMKEEKLK